MDSMARFVRRLVAFCITFSFILGVLSSSVSADGMVIPPRDHWVYQSDQKGVIYFEDGQETLVLSMKFRGDAEDFAWVIPVPSRPTVEKSREDLFENLERLTRYSYRRGPGIMQSAGFEAAIDKSEVTVWETKKIDIFEIAVLSSSDSGALREWLAQNDYAYPESYEYLLREYIDDGWFFVAVKVDTSVESSLASSRLKTGHAAPLELTFATEQPVYPMKITAVTYAPKPTPTPTPTPIVTPTPTPVTTVTPTPPYQVMGTQEQKTAAIYPLPTTRPYRPTYISVTLYVFADQKMTASGFSTQYAGWLLPKTIRNLSVDRNGDTWIDAQNKMYLTRLYRNYRVDSITEDVVLVEAGDNKTAGSGQRWVIEPWKFWLIVLLPFLAEVAILGFVLLMEMQKWARKKEPGKKPEVKEGSKDEEVEE